MSLASDRSSIPYVTSQRSHEAEHEASLPKGGSLPPDLGFLAPLGLPSGLLWKIATKAQKQGVAAHEVLLAEEIVPPDDYYRCLAQRLGLPFEADREPLGDALLIAPQGVDLLKALEGLEQPSGAVVTTPQRLLRPRRALEGAKIADWASHDLGRADASLTAAEVPSRRVGATLALALVAALAVFVGGGVGWLMVSGLVSVIVVGAISTRLAATVCGVFSQSLTARPLPDHALPRYTVLVPLYKEAAILTHLLDALERLDYPRAKLDIKLLIEADDHETRHALERLSPGAIYDIVIIPHGRPRTKPRALNVGLAYARGELLTVYDAEDDPEPMQLRRAAAAFAAAPPELACLQCPLVIDNARDSWLAGFFALEYAALFDVSNPGLARLGLPIPLGGTSNHFRVEALNRLHGWDAWNVTEDADMGVRLARTGYAVATLDAPTFEEAPARPRAWLAQRRRWMKGWMQTLIVHLRQPGRLVRELGLRRAAALIVMLAGGALGSLTGLIYTAFFIHDAVLGALFAPVTLADLFLSLVWCSVAALGSVALIAPLVIGAKRRKLASLLWLILMLPVHQALLSLASFMALVDLFRRPHHWAKTTHGLARSSLRGGRIG